MKFGNLIKISLLVVMGVALIYFGTRFYGNGIADFNQEATRAFGEALKRELAIKGAAVDSLRIVSQVDMSTIGQAPKTVFAMGEAGMVKYEISAEKHQRNIVENAEVRILHSVALGQSPIIPDTLNARWQQVLKESRLRGSTALCVAVTDVSKRVTSLKTADYTHLASKEHRLLVCNLGYICEVEITCFMGYSWWFVFYRYVMTRILLLSAACALVYFSVSYLMKMLHRPPVIKEVIVPQLVVDVPKGEVRIYQLTERLVFDAAQGLLILDHQATEMQSLQACTLLEILLHAEEHKLSDDVIMEQLWPDSLHTSVKLQTAVSRLRLFLKADPTIHLTRVHPYGYQLFL